jgi:hypothetical protein
MKHKNHSFLCKAPEGVLRRMFDPSNNILIFVAMQSGLEFALKTECYYESNRQILIILIHICMSWLIQRTLMYRVDQKACMIDVRCCTLMSYNMFISMSFSLYAFPEPVHARELSPLQHHSIDSGTC